jgi:hypothetical protein
MTVRGSDDSKVGAAALVGLFVRCIFDMLPDVPSHIRNCDEIFVLIKELSLLHGSVSTFMIEDNAIAKLVYFIVPDKVPEAIRELYLRPHSPKMLPNDMALVSSAVFDAVSSLLGVKQIQKVNLLTDRSNVWDAELTPQAKEALTIIFQESSHNGGMDSRDILAYMDKVRGEDNNPKVTAVQVRGILDRYDSTADGRLSLSGFLRYYADTAMYQPKSVWKVNNLH